MKRLVIVNGRLIIPDGILRGKVVVCRGGVIEEVVSECGFVSQPGDEIVDAEGFYVSPGFIDMHVHGGGGHDFMDGTLEAFLGAARTHACHGTTTMLPTTLTCPYDELMNVLEVYRKARELNTAGAKFAGLHLEGPYFSPAQSGAQDPAWLKTPRPEEYNAILDASEDIARWSVAPELEGALEMGRELRRRGVLASIAHSDATYGEAERAWEAGYSHVTHLYSAMSSVTRRNACRHAGVVEAAYLIDGMKVEIIADGVHLPEPLLRFVYKFKGPNKTALCTDAMRAAGMPDGEYILGSLSHGQSVIVEDGVAKVPDRSAFAGSVATADRLVRTMMRVEGVSLADAVCMMTATPAHILGLERRKGSIEAGKDADIVIFDDNINILTTISEGHVIYTE
jgi:N-acetylglucosamine-6-phosphate deacetylase